ncbi:hypothetical protein [Streptomyces neyagawaensis]|nr:hypothetical protein [Streptomyces neyagawaensis]MCL6736860.1 hypothetical protein [Streptomyces neyagawaensis]MDE1684625.1 hypothetical protein [Streptomyces neyagawaensis]
MIADQTENMLVLGGQAPEPVTDRHPRRAERDEQLTTLTRGIAVGAVK